MQLATYSDLWLHFQSKVYYISLLYVGGCQVHWREPRSKQILWGSGRNSLTTRSGAAQNSRAKWYARCVTELHNYIMQCILIHNIVCTLCLYCSSRFFFFSLVYFYLCLNKIRHLRLWYDWGLKCARFGHTLNSAKAKEKSLTWY